MHAPLAQRTEPYTSPAVLHYTLRTPLTLPQRTELFVSLSLLSLPPLSMYMGLLACPSLGSLPSCTPIPTWVWSSLGAAEGRRDPLIDLSK